MKFYVLVKGCAYPNIEARCESDAIETALETHFSNVGSFVYADEPGVYCITQRLANKIAKDEWAIISKLPVDSKGCILEDYKLFSKGTDRYTIWYWLENSFGVTIDELKEVA